MMTWILILALLLASWGPRASDVTSLYCHFLIHETGTTEVTCCTMQSVLPAT